MTRYPTSLQLTVSQGFFLSFQKFRRHSVFSTNQNEKLTGLLCVNLSKVKLNIVFLKCPLISKSKG